MLGSTVDLIFSRTEAGMLPIIAWVGMLCYTFQIFFDFSGYTDMAIGLGAIFGFHLPENFNASYCSKSVSEFWRRWHITLGLWFREYVYIPLGGNRHGMLRTCINLMVVWVLTGLWHGASYTFIFWGLGLGCVIIFEKLVAKKSWYCAIPGSVKWLGTFLIIMFSWVLFRSDGIHNAWRYYCIMFGADGCVNDMLGLRYYLDNGTLIALVTAIALTVPWPKKWIEKMRVFDSAMIIRNVLTIALLILTLLFMVNSTYSAFIYFQF